MIGICQEPFRVVMIVPLQSLQRRTREKRRVLRRKAVTFCRPDVRKTTKRTGFGRDGEKHVELCLDASQSF